MCGVNPDPTQIIHGNYQLSYIYKTFKVNFNYRFVWKKKVYASRKLKDGLSLGIIFSLIDYDQGLY